MPFNQKKIRYAYWVFVAFLKKNIQAILLSFLLSMIAVISVVSFSPYLIKLFSSRVQTIGIAGNYNLENLPAEVLSKFSNGLLYLNSEGELIPLLAESWEVLDNGQEYRFHIKKDLTWNDGTPFTAKDINNTFNDVEVIVENKNLIVYRLKKPLAIFPNFLTKQVVKYPLVGVAGVYKVDRLRTESGNVREIRLTPNKPGLPILIYKFYDTDTKLILAYKMGEISEMTTSKPNIADTFKKWKNTKVEKTVNYSRVVTVFFNMADPFLKEDKDIRHAIAQSIDKSKFNELGEYALGPLPPTSWAYNSDLKRYPFAKDTATKILRKYVEEASSPAKLKISTYYDNLVVADELKQSLDSVGIKSQVEVLSGNLERNFQILVATMALSKDPDQYFFWHSTQKRGNITQYNNVRVDKLLEDARGTFSVKERKAFYLDFQKILVEDMPAYFLYYPYSYIITRK